MKHPKKSILVIACLLLLTLLFTFVFKTDNQDSVVSSTSSNNATERRSNDTEKRFPNTPETLPNNLTEVKVSFKALPAQKIVRGNKDLLLYPDVKIADRSYSTGKVHTESPFTQVSSEITGHLTVSDLTKSAVEAEINLQAVETFLNSDAEFLPLPINIQETALLKVQDTYDRGENTVTMTGTIKGEEFSEAILTFHDGSLYGTLHYHNSGKVIEYAVSGSGLAAIREIDLSKNVYGGCDLCHDPEASSDPNHKIDKHSPILDGARKALEQEQSVADNVTTGAAVGTLGAPLVNFTKLSSDYTIDFVTTYDAAARDALGGVAAIEAKVITSVDGITSAFKNSLITDAHCSLLATSLETGTANGGAITLYNDRINGTNNSDATNLRNITGADIASYIYQGGSGTAFAGYSYEFTAGSNNIASSGSTFTHEFGHCSGAFHAWGDTETFNDYRTGFKFSLTDPQGNNSANQHFTTVMAYPSLSTQQAIAGNGNLTRIGFWSSRSQTVPVTDSLGVVHNLPLGAPQGTDMSANPYIDPNLITGGRSGTNGQWGFHPNNTGLASLGADNQYEVNNYKDNKANYQTRSTAFQVIDSPTGTYVSGDDVVTFAYLGDNCQDVQVDLYKGGVFIMTVDTMAMAAGHSYVWSVPGAASGLADGSDYTLVFSDVSGGSQSTTQFALDIRALDPVAHWAMNDCTGLMVKDSSGNGHNATLVAGTWTGEGKSSGALSLNGSSDYVSLPTSAFATVSTEMTFSLWIKGDPTQPQNGTLLYANDNGGEREITVNNLLIPAYTSFWDAGQVTGAANPNRLTWGSPPEGYYKGSWNYWVYTKNSVTGEMKIYVNGIEKASVSGQTKSIDPLSIVTLGSQLGALPYKGVIDEVKLYDIELKASEIATLYSQASNTASDLAGHWSLEEIDGTTLYDVSGNSRHATMVSGTADVNGFISGGINLDADAGDSGLTLPASAFADITDQVTLMVWAYGDASLPRQTNMFSGGGIFNTHLPWSNGAIFFDAGYTPTFDRVVYIPSNTAEYKGQWNHYAFSKDVSTGEMKIYVNGDLKATATGKTSPISNSGAVSVGGGSKYDGIIDEIQVYNKALSASEIKEQYILQSGGNGYDVYVAGQTGMTNTSFAGDGDGDLTPNGIEYIFGGLGAIDEYAPNITTARTATATSFSFVRVEGSDDCTCQIFQYGTDLTNYTSWTDLTIDPVESNITVTSLGNGTESVVITVSHAGFSNEVIFFGRLKATE